MTELATTGLADALARVQANLPHVKKNKTANTGTYSYKYADLGDIAPLIHPLLSEQGLAWLSKPTISADGRFVLAYKLMHGPSGEEETGEYPLPDPTKATAQQVGSAITYARRYTLCCATGIVPDEDDDARGAGEVKASGRRPKPEERKAERGPVEQDPWQGSDQTALAEWRAALKKASTVEELAAVWSDMNVLGATGQIAASDKPTCIDEWKARNTQIKPALASAS